MEARHAIRNSMCLRLSDFYVRRSPLFLAERDHGLPLLERLGELFADGLGWTDARRRDEEAAVRAFVASDLAWKTSFGIAPENF
jgi:glycerol-3-phosphate dehydrogenase